MYSYNIPEIMLKVLLNTPKQKSLNAYTIKFKKI